MAGQGRQVTISELESLLFYAVRYALTQEIVPPEIVTLVERHSGYISAPMMQELSNEIAVLLPRANLDRSERFIWQTMLELLSKNAQKKRRRASGRSS